jgi:hypothetical protein
MFACREPFSVSTRPSQLWPELLQQMRKRENLNLHVLVESVELQLELVGNLDSPVHGVNMS